MFPAIREEGPWFPGCEMLETSAEKKKCSDSLVMEFIYSNLQYPSESRKNCIEGVVYVRITIEKDGSVTSPTILRDIGGGCGDEVLRIIKLMPKKWQPGTQLGRPVRVQYNIPVRFKLN
ncbi:MAG: energy transducer TonB [Saprospiraceae bacterium]|nr:energy transducer TonB [Saprospiraceae bacterium]